MFLSNHGIARLSYIGGIFLKYYISYCNKWLEFIDIIGFRYYEVMIHRVTHAGKSRKQGKRYYNIGVGIELRSI
jgi:hypothetical protein